MGLISWKITERKDTGQTSQGCTFSIVFFMFCLISVNHYSRKKNGFDILKDHREEDTGQTRPGMYIFKLLLFIFCLISVNHYSRKKNGFDILKDHREQGDRADQTRDVHFSVVLFIFCLISVSPYSRKKNGFWYLERPQRWRTLGRPGQGCTFLSCFYSLFCLMSVSPYSRKKNGFDILKDHREEGHWADQARDVHF